MQESMIQVYQAKLEQAQNHFSALHLLHMQVAEAIAAAKTNVLLCHRELAACFECKRAPDDDVV